MGQKNPIIRPFLKWAGGKRQLLPELNKYKPSGFDKAKKTYYEPFVGAGAFLFELQPQKAVINDKNKELINCYKVIRDSLDELIEELTTYEEKNNEHDYYKIRYSDRKIEEYEARSPVEKAARIIYLNKTCYNGLFRVNSKNQFNVPYGKYKNPNILDETVLRAVSDYLNQNDIEILNIDFQKAVENAKKGDFIYFDPPYDPVSDTASFTGYDINGFNQDEQERLKKVVDELHEKGCKIMLSNSKTDFIMNLYDRKPYNIKTVKASRTINSKALKRGKIDEILVLNYDEQEKYKMTKNQNYLALKKVRESEVYRIFENIQFVPETTEVPFPQADSFERLVDLLSLLLKEDLTKDEITDKYAFDRRQTGYYTAAGRYLGLIEKDIEFFRLTTEAKTILAKNQKMKNLALIKKVLEHQVFYEAFKLTLDSGEIPSKKSIVEIMSQLNLDMSDSTKGRRSSTVRGWISWIWSQIQD